MELADCSNEPGDQMKGNGICLLVGTSRISLEMLMTNDRHTRKG